MATVSSRGPQKPRKIIQYGKSKSAPAFNVIFDEEVERPNQAPKQMSRSTLHNEPSKRPPDRTTEIAESGRSPRATLQPVKKRPAPTQDPYDIPLSGDEVERRAPKKRRSPAKTTVPNSHLVDDTTSNLATWEVSKEKAGPQAQERKKGGVKRTRPKTPEPDNETEKGSETNTRQRAHYASPTTPKVGAAVTSAAARLAARRGVSTKKRVSQVDLLGTETSTSLQASEPQRRTPGSVKKLKQTAGAKPDQDVAMQDPVSSNDGPSKAAKQVPEDTGVYEFPDSSADERESAQPRKPRPIARPGSKKVATTEKRTLPTSRSVPTRLADMFAADTDSTGPVSATTSGPSSRPSTPQKSATPAKFPTTPKSMTNVPRPAATMTPKQIQVWNDLLDQDVHAPSPGSLPIKELKISERRQKKLEQLRPAPALTKPTSEVGRMRRADALKAEMKAKQASDDDDEADSSDEEMEDAPSCSKSQQTATHQATESQLSQSRSQTIALGPKITYSTVRSYLPEDNFEDGLLLGFSAMASQTTAASDSPAKGMSQNTEFDVDMSDDEHGPARLKSVHELRAAGRNFSFMQETEALFEEISNHASSACSRRRSALIELASKLQDKPFVEQFTRKGFEEQLGRECQATKDDIADLILATALAYLLSAEVPLHSLITLQESGSLLWLARLLQNEASVQKLASDRRNNMSKSAQLSLTGDFANEVLSSNLLWDGPKPQTLSSRLVSLKALELFVTKLRRAGDRSELFPLSALQSLTSASGFSMDKPVETSLVISVLEALSTASASLAWPEEIVTRVATVLPVLGNVKNMPQNTIFLALRLALNLSNDNQVRCRAFAHAAVILYLLSSIEDGFSRLEGGVLSEENALPYDLLVLALGIMINLAEHDAAARDLAAQDAAGDKLSSLVFTFQQGRKRAAEAESLEQSSTNVAFGYLSIMLANLCQSAIAKQVIADRLPGSKLNVLQSAVEEFIMYHQQVDSLEDGLGDTAEGAEVWSAFTAKLKAVLQRLKAA